jgi:sugar phosphate permease
MVTRECAVSFARGVAWGLLAFAGYLAGAVLAEKARGWWL